VFIRQFTLTILTISFSLQAFSAVPSTNSFFSDLENFKNKSLSLSTEKQNLEASSDLLLSRQFFWTPRLTVSANRAKTKVDSDVTYDANYLEADLTWNLFRGGADWNSMQQASALKKAQELQVLNEALRVEAKAADLIFKSLYLIETERIQEQLFKLKEESLKIVNDRFQQGKLPLQEVTKTEVDLIQQKNKLRLAHLDYLENKSLMASLFVNEIQTKSWPFNDSVSARLSSNQMPVVEQKYWLNEAQRESWQSAKGGHWPSLDFSLQMQDSPIKERTSQQWVGLLTLSIPIWTQYETSSKVSSAYAQYLGSSNDFKDVEQTSLQKRIFLEQKIEIVRANLIEAKKNAESSRKLYQDILKGFRLGRISTNDLFLEQNRLLDTETALAFSQLSFHQGLIEICALAGYKSAECLQ